MKFYNFAFAQLRKIPNCSTIELFGFLIFYRFHKFDADNKRIKLCIINIIISPDRITLMQISFTLKLMSINVIYNNKCESFVAWIGFCVNELSMRVCELVQILIRLK